MGLTAIQYDLLAELAMNAGRVMAHEDLLHQVWGPTNLDSPRVVRNYLMRPRQMQGEHMENPTYIFAEQRVGYRMADGPTAKFEVGNA